MPHLRPALLLLALAASVSCSDSGDRGTNPPNQNPPDNTVASLTINGPGTVVFGGSIRLVAEARNKVGTLLDVEVQWSSSAPNVATVDGTGEVSAMSAGTTIISATVDTTTATREIEVLPAIATITVSGASTMAVGTSQQLTAAASSSGGSTLPAVFAWSTSNANIATVNSTGLVQAVGAGQVTITATAQGVQGTLAINVAAAQVIAPER